MAKKSINQLEQVNWPLPPSDASYLVRTLHALRDKPVEEFTIEDLRLAIGQNVALKYLLPVAVRILEQNPFAEGHYYKGDLLCSVLRASPEFYQDNPEIRRSVCEILAGARAALRFLDEIDGSYMHAQLEEAEEEFTGRQSD